MANQLNLSTHGGQLSTNGRRSDFVPSYMTKEQRDISLCIKNHDGWMALNVLYRAEKKKAPNYSWSRLSNGEWRADAAFLLAQHDKATLEAIMDGTIVQRYIAGDIRIQAAEWPVNRIYDPMIYINCIAGRNGKALNYDDYAIFLDAMEFATHFTSHGNTPNDKRFDRNGIDMESSIEIIF